MAKEQPKNQSDARVNLLSLIIRLGHESFKKVDLNSKASHILNSSKLIAGYDRSCLIDNTAETPSIIGVSGEESVNQNSEYAIMIRDMVFPVVQEINKLTELTPEFIKSVPAADKVQAYYEKYLSKTPDSNLLLVPMFSPEGGKASFIWVIEYFLPISDAEKSKIGLLSQSYGESLWYSANTSKGIYGILRKRSKKSKGTIIILICLFLALLLFTLRIDLSVSSDFELVPSDSEVEYAPFSGKIADVYVKNGEPVNKGQELIKFDVDELLYDLSSAQNSYNETLAKLDMTRQKSFKDETLLPEIKILDLQKEKDKISMDKIKWYIDHSLIKADSSGIAVIDDKKDMEGKAVNAGEKLIEIISNEKLIAEIMLNETDASVLEKINSITLYLHSMPERGIKAQVISVSPKAQFADNKQFCFIIKASFENKGKEFVYGMRGIAHVSGEKVSLGYYLIRNVLLWWRKKI